MKYKLVVFDFDGTLMDTSEGIFYCCRASMEKCGHKIDSSARWDLFIGPPLMDCFRFAFGIEDVKQRKELCKTYRELYATEGCQRAKFYPGIPELLKELKANGIYVGIASMKHEHLVEKMCRHFEFMDYIDGCSGQLDDSTVDKDILIKRLCERFNVKLSECVLVGDTDYDKEGAEKAGCDSILVSYGFGYKPGNPGTVNTVEQVRNIIFE